MSSSEVHLDLGSIAINCTTEDIGATFSWLLEEMKAAIPRLRPDERAVLRRILAHKSKSLTVSDLFPEFTRESEGHKTLRRLRAAQFIRPAKTGRWEANERIEVKPFGGLVWAQCGEACLFGDGTINSHENERDQAEGDAEIPLALSAQNQLDEEVNVHLEDEDFADWNDLLDVQDYSKEKAKKNARV